VAQSLIGRVLESTVFPSGRGRGRIEAGVGLVKPNTARWVAWSVGIFSIALLVAALILFLIDRNSVVLPESVGAWSLQQGFDLALNIPVPILGILIAARHPKNPIGWVYLSATLAFGLAAFGQGYAIHVLLVDPGVFPGGRFMAWLSTAMLPVALCALPFLFLLFPTGHLPSRRWRPVAWLSAIVGGLLTFGAIVFATALWGKPFAGFNEPVPGSLQQIARVVFFAAALALPLVLLLSFASIAVRFARARGDERLQLKWFVTAAALVAVTLSVGFFSETIAASAASSLALLFMDVAIAIAVLKYRLYEIDVIISKTIIYGVLAAFITAVYVTLVVVAGAVVDFSKGLSLLAAAIVAVAFQPVRQLAKRVANRLVYGNRATPYEVLSEFSEHVGEAYAGEDILVRMARLLAEGTGAASAIVWLRIDSEIRPAATWPTNGEPPAARHLAGEQLPEFHDASVAAPVRHQRELLGVLTLTKPPNEPLSPVEQKLTTDLAAQAGLVLRNSRLIQDLRASRQRLVTAQDEERRRLERNLHDGAQQQLVALSIRVRLARSAAQRDLLQADEMLGELEDEVTDALENLRDLARGIYPPLLADKGLASALEAHSRKIAVPVRIETDGLGRYPQEFEAAVYFCVLEALQNISKYAEASDVAVRLWQDAGDLSFSVADDGRGFDRGTTPLGAGLQNMSDRLAALGGTLEVRSQPGDGTIISGSIPVRPVEPVRRPSV
jgi:signal transduction histidine kinase